MRGFWSRFYKDSLYRNIRPTTYGQESSATHECARRVPRTRDTRPPRPRRARPHKPHLEHLHLRIDGRMAASHAITTVHGTVYRLHGARGERSLSFRSFSHTVYGQFPSLRSSASAQATAEGPTRSRFSQPRLHASACAVSPHYTLNTPKALPHTSMRQ